MALPKRRHSRARSRKRRAHWKAAVPSFVLCSSCGKPRLPHNACMNQDCGRYRVKGDLKQVVRFRERRFPKKKRQ
ncbi:MAG: 50S ribosomal protein L32 [Armatimonadota bacterium]